MLTTRTKTIPANFIRRELKDWVWEFDEDRRLLTILRKQPGEEPTVFPVLTLDRTRMFSLFRFLIRAAIRDRIAETKKWQSKLRALREKTKHGQH